MGLMDTDQTLPDIWQERKPRTNGPLRSREQPARFSRIHKHKTAQEKRTVPDDGNYRGVSALSKKGSGKKPGMSRHQINAL
jgi:hypothetical protein